MFYLLLYCGGNLLQRGFASGATTGGLFGTGNDVLTILYNDI